MSLSSEAEFVEELTILDDCLGSRKPPVDGCHVEGSLAVFTLESKKNMVGVTALVITMAFRCITDYRTIEKRHSYVLVKLL